MKLIITRHGETEENKSGILMGHQPGKLSDLGLEQGRKVGLRLKSEKIDVIYSSDLARAKDTLYEIIKYHPGVKVHYTRELRERYLGEFEGKKKVEVGWDTHYNSRAIEPKDGETITQVFERAQNFLQYLHTTYKSETVLVVAHNGINKALIANITGKNQEEMMHMENQHNTSINIFEIDQDKRHKVHAYNSIKHLD